MVPLIIYILKDAFSLHTGLGHPRIDGKSQHNHEAAKRQEERQHIADVICHQTHKQECTTSDRSHHQDTACNAMGR